ncbi:unnamed protein product [Nesidiocoris tenuis]|uniref:Uncharacterized protein n=1 Tax=Nesidiocoris tenuis TaxID=355587 RepID=A0A6H5GDS7_9HEMI|nr:unnamed protein product [Nesidiocoris tenuis]
MRGNPEEKFKPYFLPFEPVPIFRLKKSYTVYNVPEIYFGFGAEKLPCNSTYHGGRHQRIRAGLPGAVLRLPSGRRAPVLGDRSSGSDRQRLHAQVRRHLQVRNPDDGPTVHD